MGHKLIICCSSIEHKNDDDKNIEEYDDNNEDIPMKNLIDQQPLLYRSVSEQTLIPNQ